MHTDAEYSSVDDGFDALDYAYANAQGTVRNALLLGERSLWCAVIAQAFYDMGAFTPSTSGRRPGKPRTEGRTFDEAARWLLRNQKDFPYICDLAGVSPHIIRRAAQIFLSRMHLAP